MGFWKVLLTSGTQIPLGAQKGLSTCFPAALKNPTLCYISLVKYKTHESKMVQELPMGSGSLQTPHTACQSHQVSYTLSLGSRIHLESSTAVTHRRVFMAMHCKNDQRMKELWLCGSLFGLSEQTSANGVYVFQKQRTWGKTSCISSPTRVLWMQRSKHERRVSTQALCILAEPQISQAVHLPPALHKHIQIASRHGLLHPVLEEVPCLVGWCQVAAGSLSNSEQSNQGWKSIPDVFTKEVRIK